LKETVQSCLPSTPSGGNTRRLLREERPRWDNAVRSTRKAHQPPVESVVYFRSGIYIATLFRYLQSKSTKVTAQFMDFISNT